MSVKTLQTVTYDRRAAVRYALRHYNRPNPDYANMDALGAGGDCTNFTSQCLLAGGMQMDYRRTGQETEWWYRRLGSDPLDEQHDDWWSCTWSLPENQWNYLVANQGRTADLLDNPSLARLLDLADLVFYDYHGQGRFTHGAIVTAKSRSRIPYVTYRTLLPRRPVRNVHWQLRFRGRPYRIFGVRLNDQLQVFPSTPDYSRLIPCDQIRS
ncbi:MAG: amidase domain-containing protein [Bacillota bacterium]|jgi:cell wall-associated NlpC family hydrolase